jgi:hypothetical protein
MQMAEAHTRDAKKYKIKKGHDLWPRAKTLAEGGTAQDIERAINSGVHIVEFSAGSSSITDTQAAVNLTDRFPRRYEVVEMPRAGHGSYEINPFSIPLFVQAVEGFNP